MWGSYSQSQYFELNADGSARFVSQADTDAFIAEALPALRGNKHIIFAAALPHLKHRDVVDCDVNQRPLFVIFQIPALLHAHSLCWTQLGVVRSNRLSPAYLRHQNVVHQHASVGLTKTLPPAKLFQQ